MDNRSDAAPGDRHSDADHDECGEPKKHAQTNITKNAFEPIRPSDNMRTVGCQRAHTPFDTSAPLDTAPCEFAARRHLRSSLECGLAVLSEAQVKQVSQIPEPDKWLSFGLAFVGGYGDAAGFVLARTFTGHFTGNLVLGAVSIAAGDWRATLARVGAIVCFLGGNCPQCSDRAATRGLATASHGHGNGSGSNGNGLFGVGIPRPCRKGDICDLLPAGSRFSKWSLSSHRRYQRAYDLPNRNDYRPRHCGG